MVKCDLTQTILNIYKKFWEQLIAYFPWDDTGHIETDASTNSSVAACIFVTAVTYLAALTEVLRGFLQSL
jgi:hypothetical protein